jgi:hypothetical protein
VHKALRREELVDLSQVTLAAEDEQNCHSPESSAEEKLNVPQTLKRTLSLHGGQGSQWPNMSKWYSNFEKYIFIWCQIRVRRGILGFKRLTSFSLGVAVGLNQMRGF